jgi:DNA-binding beta-propeller fold protein YncE
MRGVLCFHTSRALRLTSLLIVLWSSCAAPPPVFTPVDPPLLWPPEEERPRYAYVGKIEGEEDLKRQRSVWEWFSSVVVGSVPRAKIGSAHGVAVSRQNVLYVTDPDSRTVHRFDLERREYQALTDAGNGRNFVLPIGVALREGKVLVSDRVLRSVTVLSSSGEPEAVLGMDIFESPVGLAVGESGRIYVADVTAHSVKVLDQSGKMVLSFGRRGRGAGEFNYPTYVACDTVENIYVSDTLNSRIQVFNSDGGFLKSWGERGDFPGNLSQPKGIACDQRGFVYIVDAHFENVQVFTPEGRLLLALGEEGYGPGQFGNLRRR